MHREDILRGRYDSWFKELERTLKTNRQIITEPIKVLINEVNKKVPNQHKMRETTWNNLLSGLADENSNKSFIKKITRLGRCYDCNLSKRA